MTSPMTSKVSKLNLSPDSTKKGTPPKLGGSKKQPPTSASAAPSPAPGPGPQKRTPKKLNPVKSTPTEELDQEPSLPATPTPKGKGAGLGRGKTPSRLSEQRSSPAPVPDDLQSQASGSTAPGGSGGAGGAGGGGLGRSLGGLTGKVKDTAQGATKGVGETAKGATKGVTGAAKGATKGVGDTAKGATKGLGVGDAGAGDVVGDVADTAQGAVEGATDTAQGATEGVTDTAQGATKDVGDTAQGATKDVGEALPENLGPIDLSVLKGLEIGEDGLIHDKDGNAIGRLAEGQPEHLVGYAVGDNGEILDEDGDLVGVADVLPDAVKHLTGGVKDTADQAKETVEGAADQAQETAGDVAKGVTELADLADRPLGETGEIKDDEGNVIGRLAEGDAEDLAGYAPNKDGEILDDEGDLIGRVELVPQVQDIAEEAQEQVGDTAEGVTGQVQDTAEGAKDVAESVPEQAEDAFEDAQEKVQATAAQATKTLTDLAERPLDATGEIKDDEGNVIGRLAEGDPEDLAGYAANEAGEILDDDGDLIGRVELVPGQLEETAGEATKGITDLAELAERPLDESGEIKDDQGNVIGRLAEGSPEDLVGYAANEAGEILDDDGDLIGRIEIVSQAAKGAESAAGKISNIGHLADRPLSASGAIKDDQGNRIGKLVEGNPEDLAGYAPNEEGEILGDDGELLGRVEIASQALAKAQSIAGKISNIGRLADRPLSASGAIKDEQGNVLGKLVEGNPDELAGYAPNADGEILGDDGELLGRVDVASEARKETESAAGKISNIGRLAGRPLSASGGIRDDQGNRIGKLVEGNPEELVGKVPNEEGEILDDDGDLIGRVDVASEARKETESVAGKISNVGRLADRPLSASGAIRDDQGRQIGKLVEGNPEELAGQVANAEGEILNEDGDVLGRVDIASQARKGAESAASGKISNVAALAERPLSASGAIRDDKGRQIGKLVEGDAEELAGQVANADGEILDDDGEVIGRVDIASQARKAESTASGKISNIADLAGRPVSATGAIRDDKGRKIGQLVEGDPEDLQGYAANEAGEILDDEGDVIGRVEIASQARKLTQSEAEAEAEAKEGEGEGEGEEENIPPLSSLEGLKCNKLGKIVDRETGRPIGELIEGDPKKIANLGATLDDKGQFWDNRGRVIGKVKALPVEEHTEEPIFAGLEGLTVVEDGWVEDQNGKRVGRIVEGDPKKVLGRYVDEDGDVLDKHGNIIAKAEYYEAPEEPEPEAIDLSSLEGLTPNKLGYVIGPKGVPIARVVEGKLKELAGKEIHDGQIWDGGKPIGRVELIPQEEREKTPEGPFAGLEDLVVNKEGFVEDDDGNVVGKVVEGDIRILRGRAVDEDGEIIDKYGNVKGRAEPWEAPEEEAPDLSILEGKTVNKSGNVVDAQGNVFGRVVSGEKGLAGRKVDGKGQVWGDNGKVIGQAELIPGAEEQKPEGVFFGFENVVVGKNGLVTDASGQVIGRVIEGDPKRLQGRSVDEDGDILDKNGNAIGKAERWEPEEKKRDVNPMSGRKVNREGEVRDADGNLIGKLTAGNLPSLIGKSIDDNGYVVDNDGNKIGECTLIENIPEPEPEEPQISQEELEAQRKAEEDRELAKKMTGIIAQTLDRLQPICRMITEHIDKAEKTPKDELDEEQLVKDVKPLLEEGGQILQECNGSIRALDPDGHIAATAKARAATHEASPEEYGLADHIKTLTDVVVKTIENGKKKIAGMPHAKKKLNPLWVLLSEPLGQIIAAVGLLLAGVLGLVGRLLQGLGLGGLVNGLLGGLGLDKLLGSLGLGTITDSLGITGKK